MAWLPSVVLSKKAPTPYWQDVLSQNVKGRFQLQYTDRFLPSGDAKHPTKEKLEGIFDEFVERQGKYLTKQKDLMKGDGCFVRAEIMARELSDLGLEPVKVWVHFPPGSSPSWGYHVGVAIPDDKHDLWIFDPWYSKKLSNLSGWIEPYVEPGPYLLPVDVSSCHLGWTLTSVVEKGVRGNPNWADELFLSVEECWVYQKLPGHEATFRSNYMDALEGNLNLFSPLIGNSLSLVKSYLGIDIFLPQPPDQMFSHLPPIPLTPSTRGERTLYQFSRLKDDGTVDIAPSRCVIL
jgi:hypothetical protein